MTKLNYFVNACNDLIFKRLLLDEVIAKDIISLITSINLKNQKLEYIDSEINPSLKAKGVRFDVRLIVNDKYDIDLEMQNQRDKNQKNMALRIRSYLGDMISTSISKGKKYSEAKECIIIIFANFKVNKEKCIDELKITNKKFETFTEDKIYIIDLTKISKCDNMRLQKWLKILTSNNLKEYYGEDEIMDRAIDLIYEMNNKEYYKVKRIQEYETNYISELDYVEKKGIRKGKVEGRKEGKQEGIKAVITALYNNNYSVEVIAKSTNMSIDEVKKILGL